MKFGKDVAGSVVEVPEKFGLIGASLAGLGISPSTWCAGS